MFCHFLANLFLSGYSALLDAPSIIVFTFVIA
jgi:hypothetical protein